jgi:hypothetical protein
MTRNSRFCPDAYSITQLKRERTRGGGLKRLRAPAAPSHRFDRH